MHVPILQQEHRHPPVHDRHADIHIPHEQEEIDHVPGIMAFPSEVTMTIDQGVPLLHLSGIQRDILSAERPLEDVGPTVTLQSNLGLRV